MSAEPSTESAPVAVAARADVAGGPGTRSATPPRTERELNAPSPLTVGFLGVVFLATFLPWVAAKVGCNGREAPVRTPPDLALDVLTRQPKDAALELQQRAATGQYKEAAELAKGDAQRELLEADARCQTTPLPCAVLRDNAASVTTRAVLVGRGPLLAEARVESQLGDKVERYVVKLQAENNRWFVTSRTPYSGDLLAPVPVIQLTPGGVPPSIAAPPAVPPAAPVPPHAAVPPAAPGPPGAVAPPRPAPEASNPPR